VDSPNAREGKPRVLHQGGHASQDRFVFRGSGIVVAVVGAYGGHCSRGAVLDVSATTKALVALVGENGLGGKASSMPATPHASRWSRHRRLGRSDQPPGRDRRGDRRLYRPCRRSQTVHGTMARHSLGDGRDGSWLADRAHDREHVPGNQKGLKTDHPDQVDSRLAFWRGYLPHIRRAYLLCAARAKPIADGLNEKYGSLEGGDRSHCGLLMEIVGPQGDRIVALEVNKNASTLFWKPNSKKKPPDFYSQGAYHRPTYMGACDRRIYHTSGWRALSSSSSNPKLVCGVRQECTGLPKFLEICAEKSVGGWTFRCHQSGGWIRALKKPSDVDLSTLRGSLGDEHPRDCVRSDRSSTGLSSGWTATACSRRRSDRTMEIAPGELADIGLPPLCSYRLSLSADQPITSAKGNLKLTWLDARHRPVPAIEREGTSSRPDPNASCFATR